MEKQGSCWMKMQCWCRRWHNVEMTHMLEILHILYLMKWKAFKNSEVKWKKSWRFYLSF